MSDRTKNIAALKRERYEAFGVARCQKSTTCANVAGSKKCITWYATSSCRFGGVYVKFLQGVLFSSPVMQRWHSPSRLKIFENLDTQPIDVITCY